MAANKKVLQQYGIQLPEPDVKKDSYMYHDKYAGGLPQRKHISTIKQKTEALTSVPSELGSSKGDQKQKAICSTDLPPSTHKNSVFNSEVLWNRIL